MFMRRIIHVLLFVVFIFLLNLIFYFVSDDYKEFIKQVKTGEKPTDQHSTFPDDITVTQPEQSLENDEENITDSTDALPYQPSAEDTFIPQESKKVLGKNYQIILDGFSSYNFDEIELTTNLFDITNEYPDDYYEFYSKDLTLYFFDTKTYSEVKDIFDVLSYDVSFSVNEVDNFANASFYINLNEDIQDNYIRIVMNYKWVVVGLKVKRDQYNQVKQILESL